MKRTYWLFGLIAAVLLAACTHEQEDFFDESSADRIDTAIKTDLEVLTSASNGWLMEYFPQAQQGYGGYNILVKFGADGNATVASEIASPEATATSLFTVKQSAGVTLSFDSYNDIFHAFSDPSDPLGVGGAGYGMEGDYDFLVVDATPEKVVLKGKKTGGYATLTPMQGAWDEYIASVQAAEAVMANKKYQLDVNGTTVSVSVSYRTLTFDYEEDGNAVSTVGSYIVTPTGYKFYEPVDINGNKISSLDYNEANDDFTSDAGFKMIKIIPPLNEQFIAGDWFIAMSAMGKFGTPYFNYVENVLATSIGEELEYAFIGSLLYGSFGFNFSSSGYTGLLGYDYQLSGEDKITMGFNFTGQGNGVWYHNNAAFNYMLNVFGYNSPRTFTITADDPKNPTYVVLTEDANPDNTIGLSSTPIYYPFKN